MTEEATVVLRQKRELRFAIDCGVGIPALYGDEAPPLGGGAGARALSAEGPVSRRDDGHRAGAVGLIARLAALAPPSRVSSRPRASRPPGSLRLGGSWTLSTPPDAVVPASVPEFANEPQSPSPKRLRI